MSLQGNNAGTYFAFSVIAIVAFFGNLLVIAVLLTKKEALKKPYNIFIFSLSTTDIVTSIFLIFSRYLYLPPMPGGRIAAQLFCSTIWNACILFGLGYVSIYTCLVLTIERWLAVVKPMTYKNVKAKHAWYGVVFVWVWGLLVQATTLFRGKPDFEKGQCRWAKLSIGEGPFPYIDITLQCIIPFSVMVFLYSHMRYKITKMPHLLQGRGANLTKRITIIALAASGALIIGWLPSRVSFLLSKLNLNDANGLVHFLLVMLSFSNSCVNPFLYGIYSPQVRNDYKVLLTKILVLLRIAKKLEDNELPSLQMNETRSTATDHPLSHHQQLDTEDNVDRENQQNRVVASFTDVTVDVLRRFWLPKSRGFDELLKM